VYGTVLQCVAQIDEAAAEAAFVGYGYSFSSVSVGVQHPKYEPRDLVVYAGQFCDQHQFVVPFVRGHRVHPTEFAIPVSVY
jgi:hypothetical protein